MRGCRCRGLRRLGRRVRARRCHHKQLRRRLYVCWRPLAARCRALLQKLCAVDAGHLGQVSAAPSTELAPASECGAVRPYRPPLCAACGDAPGLQLRRWGCVSARSGLPYCALEERLGLGTSAVGARLHNDYEHPRLNYVCLLHVLLQPGCSNQ